MSFWDGPTLRVCGRWVPLASGTLVWCAGLLTCFVGALFFIVLRYYPMWYGAPKGAFWRRVGGHAVPSQESRVVS